MFEGMHAPLRSIHHLQSLTISIHVYSGNSCTLSLLKLLIAAQSALFQYKSCNWRYDNMLKVISIKIICLQGVYKGPPSIICYPIDSGSRVKKSPEIF